MRDAVRPIDPATLVLLFTERLVHGALTNSSPPMPRYTARVCQTVGLLIASDGSQPQV